MSNDDTSNVSKENEVDKAMEDLKNEATELGISFGAKIGMTTLIKRIIDVKAEQASVDIVKKEVKKTPEQINKEKYILRERIKKDQTKLIRVVIHCNNEAKRELTGETKKFSNSIVGSYTKFIPFDVDEGYHIPQCMLDSLKGSMCQKFKTVKLASGETVKQSFVTQEYTITVLPPLTQEELDTLADDQRARGAID